MNTIGSRNRELHLPPAHSVMPDDRVALATRWVAAFIIPFLLAAFAILYLLPDDTARLFAWTIKPRMTPLVMGAGYIAGAYFFMRVLTAARWHEVALGFLPITAFTIFMAIATLLHLDRFNHAHVSFFTWLALYLITPILVPFIWFRNRPADPGTFSADDVEVPAQVRRVLGVVGILQFLFALILLIRPQLMIGLWPWKLTPLTARVLGGWFALPSVVSILMGREPRWSAVRMTLESQLIGLGLVLVAAPRAWTDFNQSAAAAWVFFGGIGLLWFALLVLYVAMEQRRRTLPRASARGGTNSDGYKPLGSRDQ